MKDLFLRLSVPLVLGASCGALATVPDRALTDEQWRQDLQQLSSTVREVHFKPFHNVTALAFEDAVQQLDASIPTLSDKEIIVAMARIVAMLRDGHTRLHIPRSYPALALEAERGHSGTAAPAFDALKFSQLPVAFGLYEDGLFITGADSAHSHLVGRQVVAFDETAVADALEAVKAVSFFENDSRARLMAPDRLALPEVMAILGLIDNPAAVTLELAPEAGNAATATLHAQSGAALDIAHPPAALSPLWLRNRHKFRWYEVLDDERSAIYVQVNQFEENPQSPYGDFVAETLAEARAHKVHKYIIDLRHNSGGIGAWVIPFVTGLSRSEFNVYGRLYILIGSTTFSAAQHFLHRFEEFSYAMFVGEPSGAKPSHYGDGRRTVLTHSGLTLRVSTIYWHSWLANDFRDAINPHLDAPMRSGEYFAGQDPALEAALAYRPPRGIALQIEQQFRAEKNQNAVLLFQRYMSDASIRDHRPAMPELLGMADRLAEDGIIRPAYFTYFLVDQSYPGDPATEAGLKRLKALMD